MMEDSAPTVPTLHYQVSMPQPESHIFEVVLRVGGWQASVLDLKMPVWTPGSYLVREYAKHLQEFSAEDVDESPLLWKKLSKNHWQIKTGSHPAGGLVNASGRRTTIVRYRIFASELTVRTNHLDRTHGFFNPAAVFCYLPGYEGVPIRVTVIPPQPEWQVVTPLPLVPGEANTFLAKDFDTLVDSPFEIGTHRIYYFDVEGRHHELVIWGEGNEQPSRMVQDIEQIIKVESRMFGGLPYDRYVFLLHLSASGYGGLEHKYSCTLNYPRLGFRAPDQYHRFLQLVAHEFFHLWNVKRIRPKALEAFDYEGENYTPSLWFCEGATSYYDLLIPLRAGIYDAKTFLQSLSKDITRLLTTPGRLVQSASESSWDAWIKLYRRDANSDNSQISYYIKGAMISLLLDLLIRARHNNARSLDDVMRYLWQEFGISEIGFTPEQLQAALTNVAGINLDEFFAKYIDGTDELPFDDYLEPFGLQLQSVENGNSVPFTGWTVKAENGKPMIKFVHSDSPAEMAGINADDELLAINGLRVTAEQLSERLKDFQAGETLSVTVFHQDELLTTSLTLAPPRPSAYRIVPVKQSSLAQENNFKGWLGSEFAILRQT